MVSGIKPGIIFFIYGEIYYLTSLSRTDDDRHGKAKKTHRRNHPSQ